MAPELAYSHEKRKLFNKFGYKGYTRNKDYLARLDKTNPDSSNSKPHNSSLMLISDKQNNNSSFQRNQFKADSSFYENRVSNILKARNKTQEKVDSGSAVIVSVNAKRRVQKLKVSNNGIQLDSEASPLRIFDQSVTQMSKASLINETNVNDQSMYSKCQNDMEQQSLHIKKPFIQNYNNYRGDPSEIYRNSSTRGSQQQCSILNPGSQTGASSIKNITRQSTTVVPSMRGNTRPSQQQILNSILPHIPGIPQQLLMELYEARCLDLKINPSKNQMLRFFDLIKRNCAKQCTKLNLSDMGFGDNSLKVIAKIIRNNEYFSDLRKNFVSGTGLSSLGYALLQNERIVHLDLGCNQINGESAEQFFTILQNQNSITSINLANLDCYKYKNKLGIKGSQALGLLIAKNPLISMINLTDNALSSEAIYYLMEGIRRNPNMVSLNISQNDIGSNLNTFNCVTSLFKSSKSNSSRAQCPNLEELILSSNCLTNKNIEEMTEVLNNCPKINLKRIDFSNNKFSSKGLVSLIQCLKNNPQIKISHLNFEKANLDQGTLQDSLINYKLLLRLIFEFLRTNKTLMYLNLSHCFINNEVMNQIGKALYTNDKLATLILRGNKIDQDGLKEFFKSCYENKNLKLKMLDLSSNKLTDEVGPKLAQALKQVKTLEQLSLKDNTLGIESNDAFLFLAKEKTNLWKLQLELNMIKYMTLLEIEKTCKRNKALVQKHKLPVIRKEINNFLNKRDPNIKIDTLDAQLKRQKKEIEVGFKYVLEEEEFVHDVINQGDEELKELEEIKNKLDEEMNRLDTIIEGIDFKIYEKQRECERKVVDEQALVEKCQDHNMRLEKRIEKQKERNQQRRTQLTKVGEEGKLIEELEGYQKEERMLSLIIENYEKEITKREIIEDKRCVSSIEPSNALHSILSQEKELFRVPIAEEKDPKRCISTGKDGIRKKQQKKSKGRSTKKAINHGGAEKHIKGLLNMQAPMQQLDVKQR